MKKTDIEKIIKELENQWRACRKIYLAYPDGKYDADYYLFLGKAEGLGNAIDMFEDKLKELK